VLVVVVAVSGVPAPVVNVVNVIAVRNGHMATAVAVNMPMLRVHLVLGRRLTFVVVVGVSSMQVTVVHVVDVIPVRHRDMPAAIAVGVGVIGMLFVSCIGHRCIAAVRCYSKRISLSDASTRPEPSIRLTPRRRPNWHRSSVSRGYVGHDRRLAPRCTRSRW
jgi:hypothetical protein